jgi:hypothetical protein
MLINDCRFSGSPSTLPIYSKQRLLTIFVNLYLSSFPGAVRAPPKRHCIPVAPLSLGYDIITLTHPDPTGLNSSTHPHGHQRMTVILTSIWLFCIQLSLYERAFISSNGLPAGVNYIPLGWGEIRVKSYADVME